MVLCLLGLVAVSSAYLPAQFNTWQPEYVKYSEDGQGLTLVLDRGETAAGCGTKASWLFGHFGAWIKLPGGNAAGTVATFYLSSPSPNQCEFDLEFLGHLEGHPRKIHTNVFVDGEGGMEQQILFPDGIDPTASYHYYSFEWHKDVLVFYVDWKPIRMFKNLEGTVPGFKYCNHKAMSLYMSIWDGDSWATEGGSVKLDWNAAPFEFMLSNIQTDGCNVDILDPNSIAKCQQDPHATGPGVTEEQFQYMQNIRDNATLVKYNYCTDYARYPEGTRPECQYNAM
jgi:xyloglucan:xyloglucosyl transferase